MRYEPKHFTLDELICEDVFNTYGQTAWEFFDQRLLITIDIIREHLNKPMYVNNWQIHGQFDERGFRCLRCPLVKNAIAKNKMYVSPHMTGQAIDFDVEGMTAEEVRQWLVANEFILPYPIRLEGGVSWVHLDTRDHNSKKIFIFNP